MKRFLLFGFDGYYPSGGVNDLAKPTPDFDTLEEAKTATPVFAWKYSDGSSHHYEFWQVLDTETGETVDNLSSRWES